MHRWMAAFPSIKAALGEEKIYEDWGELSIHYLTDTVGNITMQYHCLLMECSPKNEIIGHLLPFMLLYTILYMSKCFKIFHVTQKDFFSRTVDFHTMKVNGDQWLSNSEKWVC